MRKEIKQIYLDYFNDNVHYISGERDGDEYIIIAYYEYDEEYITKINMITGEWKTTWTDYMYDDTMYNINTPFESDCYEYMYVDKRPKFKLIISQYGMVI